MCVGAKVTRNGLLIILNVRWIEEYVDTDTHA